MLLNPSGIFGIFAVTSLKDVCSLHQVIVLVMCGPIFHLLMDVVGCARGLR